MLPILRIGSQRQTVVMLTSHALHVKDELREQQVSMNRDHETDETVGSQINLSIHLEMPHQVGVFVSHFDARHDYCSGCFFKSACSSFGIHVVLLISRKTAILRFCWTLNIAPSLFFWY